MGMGISSTGSTAATQSTSVAAWQQRQQSFQTMMSALQSGDLATAQQAFSSLGGNASQGSGPLAQLGQALKSGDLAGAQKAAAELQSARASHHHHQSGGSSSASASQLSIGAPGTGTLVNVTA